MLTVEQEQILQRARLRQQRAHTLRRLRLIAQLRNQIELEAMWADPRRRRAYDQQRRLFYQTRPHLYEPMPKLIGRRALLAGLGTLLVTPVLAHPSSLPTLPPSHRRTNLTQAPASTAAGSSGSRVDVRNFSTTAHP